MAIRLFRLSPLLLLAVVAMLVPGFASSASPVETKNESYDQFIVRFAPGSTAKASATARQRVLAVGADADGLTVVQLRRLAVGADVVKTNRKLSGPEAEAFMNRLRRDPSVNFVEIDRRMKATFSPNDPRYPEQWHYYEATGGINLPAAWDQSTGAGVVVAVIDTGITPHSDLNGNVVAGYDFIDDLKTARDGDGRDPNPNDQGDWATADYCSPGSPATNSTWHGTHVAGTVAAVTNNANGVAGVAFNAKIMPLRVLGRCGGFNSDISDAIVWAAGGAVPGIPNNPNPVEVINMSLGGAGSCGQATQDAINVAVAAGTVVVVAAGNDDQDASGFEPANCSNVIVVGATGRSGAKAYYSNFGSTVDVSAPGGTPSNPILSTINTGTTIQAAEGYTGFQGTSMATPHVAGTVALMQSAIVSSPAAVESILKNTARSFPVACVPGCGAGIINAAAAIAGAVTGVLTITDQAVSEGDSGTKLLTFTVNLSKPMPGTVSFDVNSANGSAVAGSDYVALNLPGQSIAAGATSRTFSVTVNGDTLVETNELFFINISNVVGIPVADSQGQGTILNDDATALSNGVPVNSISGSTGQTFLYSLAVPANATSVTFTTSGGTGDADIYVKFGSLPTSSVYDCKSDGLTTAETCTITPTQAGTYYLLLNAFADISGVSLVGSYATPTPVLVPLVTTDQYLWMVPPAANSQQQGFLRLINRQAASGLVTVWGLDATGQRSSGTVTLTLSPLETRQFNSGDLEAGNASKGLSGSLGTGTGNWTVIVRTDLDVEALAYIRTPDGFLTSMHDRVVGNGVDWPVEMFNPADNPYQVSHLRLINTNVAPVSIQITGTDDAGVASTGTVTLTVAGLASADLTSVDLESGNAGKGLSGSLGNGTGKWQLLVSATGRLTVQSLLYDPLGKLTNLSTLPDLTQAVAGQRVLWFVPPASNTQQQGFVRLINRDNRASTVSLRGIDDAGVLSPGTASFTLAAKASAQFNSQDLELGNVGKGLSGSLGDGAGNWRLLVTTDLNVLPMGLIRTPDGFLTTVHDVVAGNGLTGSVVIFNPADNPLQVSVLRLVNPNNAAVNVTIQGIDDAGAAGPGGAVSLTLAAAAAKELSATDLESGNAGLGLTGSLGNGSGKWRLSVTATAPVKVLSLLRDPNGFLTDLSTAAKGGSGKLDP